MGTQLAIDLQRFFLTYHMLDGEQGPDYQVISTKSGAGYPNPYNTQNTPFLIPFDNLGKFGYNVSVKSLASQAVWWSARTEFIRPNLQFVASQGFSGTQPSFTFRDGMVGSASKPSLDPGGKGGAGMTPIYAAPPVPGESPAAREFIWQPKDLIRNNPVKMRVTVSARSSFANATPGNLIPDVPPIPANPPNVLEIWIMLV